MLGIGNLITVETVMVFGIGFLTAALLALAAASAVHNRAVRLTTRRLDATIPLSVKEMQAEKDAQRGKFAAATAQLERSVETLRAKGIAHNSELARRAALIDKLKAALEEKSAAMTELETREQTLAAREKELWDELLAAKNDVTARIAALQEAETTMARLRAEIAGLTAAAEGREHTLAARERELSDELLAARNQVTAKIAALQEAEAAGARMRAEVATLTAAVEQRGRLIDSQYNEIAALAARHESEQREVRMPRALPADVKVFEPRPATTPAPPAPAADNVKPYEPRTTAEWLEFGKAKLRSGNGDATRVPYEKSTNGVRPL